MIIYGKQLFFHLLKNKSDKIVKIYLAKECEKSLFRQISSLNKQIIKVDNKKAQALAKGGNHQGFLAEVKDFEFADFSSIKSGSFVVVLYGLSDVGNIGAIIRTAYALGVSGVVIIAKNIAIEGVIRASSGAAYEIPICLGNDGLSVINELKQVGFEILATNAGGDELKKLKLGSKISLVMGSEGDGLPNKVIQKCDYQVGIKMKNNWDSLNVSAAFAIFCDRIMNG